jgi:hypothetical protein
MDRAPKYPRYCGRTPRDPRPYPPSLAYREYTAFHTAKASHPSSGF